MVTASSKIRSNNLSNFIKLYKLTTRYVCNLNSDMVAYLNSFIGNTINDLPFIGSYLNKYVVKLANVQCSYDVIRYTFDFSIEKIAYNEAAPFKKIVHYKVSCSHYLESNIVSITQTEVVEDNLILSLMSLIPYSLALGASRTELPSYTPPRWKPIEFSMEELNCISIFLVYMLEKQIDALEPLEVLCSKMIMDDLAAPKTVTVKPYRTIGLIISNRSEEITEKLILSIKGELKANYCLSPEMMENFIMAAAMIKSNNSTMQLLIPPANILEDYFNILHKDMFNEAKGKLKRKILEDFISLTYFYENGSNKVINKPAYFFFTVCFNTLLSLAVNNEYDGPIDENYAFCYEALADFITLYAKHRHQKLLKESDLNKIFASMVGKRIV